LLIIDENDNKESIRVLRLDEDTLVLKYIDYDIIEAYPKRL